MDVGYRGAKGRLLFKALAWVAITVGLFLLLEGGASFVIFLRELQTKGGVLRPGEIKERSHAVFDAELGWVNKPNVRFDDFYGLGKHLLINSQGFRNEEVFTPDVPLGMQRVICSGDSYTLGFGVANQDTWCAQLEVLFPHLQAVNMGQGGYGVDQA